MQTLRFLHLHSKNRQNGESFTITDTLMFKYSTGSKNIHVVLKYFCVAVMHKQDSEESFIIRIAESEQGRIVYIKYDCHFLL